MSVSNSHATDALDPVWTSSKSVQIPPTDIVSYVFGNLSQYDNDSPIFIEANNPSSTISANQALRTVLRLTAGLKAQGLKEGDCVCLHAFNSIWYPLIWLGIVGSGGRVVGSNPRYTKTELVHLLDLTKPKFIIAQAECIGPVVEAAATAQEKIDTSNIFVLDSMVEAAELDPPNSGPAAVIDNTAGLDTQSPTTEVLPAVDTLTKTSSCSNDLRRAPKANPQGNTDLSTKPDTTATDDAPLARGLPSWQTLLHEHQNDWPHPLADAKFDQESIAVYGMTSGTTGLPKAAMISHRAIVAQTALLEDQWRARPYQQSQLICLPIFHAFATPLALVLPLRLGVPTFFLPKWSLPEYVQAIEKHAITDIPVCPPIVGALTQLPVLEQPRLKSLRSVISAGAVLPATVQNQLYNVLAPEAVVTQVWGTTEAGWHTLGDLQEKDRSGSVGSLLPNAQLKLVSELGDLIAEDGKPGEALVKTSMLFSGYLESPKANDEAFDLDGFYRTGDQLCVRGGNLYYSDRIKETMKVKGWQVSPTELEAVLLQHPRIADAAVVGVTRKNMLGIPETYPTAYVVCRIDDDVVPLREEEVKGFVATKVISYKRITGDVVFVKQISRSPAGKILRRELPQAERDSSHGSLGPIAQKENTSWLMSLTSLFRGLWWSRHQPC